MMRTRKQQSVAPEAAAAAATPDNVVLKVQVAASPATATIIDQEASQPQQV